MEKFRKNKLKSIIIIYLFYNINIMLYLTVII